MARADVTGGLIHRALADDASGAMFEELFRRLIERERELRHVVGTAEIHGPTRRGKGDGGSDIMFVVHDLPRVSRRDFVEPLTWDELGRTWYTLKNGPHWADLVKRDVGYGEFIVKPEKARPRKLKPPSSKLLEHVAGGGRYVIVVSQPDGDGDALRDTVAKALAYWLRESGKTAPDKLHEQLVFKTANQLATFIRAHSPSLPTTITERLSLTVPDGLLSWAEWSLEIDRGRERPRYQADESRQRLIEFIQSSNLPRQITRIFGPPGIGKTRLVHHALAGTDTDRIRYTAVVAVGQEVVRSNWLEQDAGAITLVVDEVTSYDARDIMRDFRTKAPVGANLILLGVTDEDAREETFDDGQVVRLGDLSREQMRVLVEAEFGDSVIDEQVQIVLDLSEGYPLFAVLLARGLAKDQDFLTRSDGHSTHQDAWDAAKRVLAGGRVEHGGDEQRWRLEAKIRAKCLLVVIMTGDLDLPWSELWSLHGEALRRAVCEPHEARLVQAAHDSCEQREILRRVGRSHRRYVSPANLSRIIINHFFSGPDDLGPRIARHVPEFLARLSAQAERVQAAPEVLRRLAEHAWDELERRVRAAEPLGAFIDRSRTLDIAAEQTPERAVQVLTEAVRRCSSDELAQAKQLRHVLRRLFQQLVQLPISAAAFEQVEDALFCLAKVEDEPWANNAIGIWKSLALVALSQTHQPWQLRFELLSRRCRFGSPDERRLALEGLAVAVANNEEGLGHSRPNYDWPIPQGPEVWTAKRQAWSLLIHLCDDPESVVAARAREIVATQLPGCVGPIGVGVPLLDAIEQSVSSWTPDQRLQLSETLGRSAGVIDAELRVAIDKLKHALAPSNFAERLVHQVGSWNPARWVKDAEQTAALERARDESLAHDAITNPALLIEQFAWLSSADAKRRRPFLRTLGRLDQARVLFAPLEAFEVALPDPRGWLLPWYIEGWAELGDEHQPDQWLGVQLGGGPHRRLAAFALPFLQPSAKRLRWLIDVVRHGQVEPFAPPMVKQYCRWLSDDLLQLDCELIEAMADQPAYAPAGVSVANGLLDMELGPDTRERVLLVAGRLLRSNTREHMPSVTEFDWERLVAKLVDGGRVDDAVGAIVELASTDVHHNLSLVDRVIRMLIERGLAGRLWTAVFPSLDGERGSFLMSRLRDAGLLSAVDPDTVMAWVGAQERRASVVADMLSPYGDDLSTLARYLLIRFGGDGEVGSVLAARVFSTRESVRDRQELERRQLEHARSWAKDEAPTVRSWALHVVGDLEQSIAEAEVQEEVRRKYG